MLIYIIVNLDSKKNNPLGYLMDCFTNLNRSLVRAYSSSRSFHENKIVRKSERVHN